MIWRRGRPDKDRIESEQATEDARITVQALTAQLEAAVDRLEHIADKLEGRANG